MQLTDNTKIFRETIQLISGPANLTVVKYVFRLVAEQEIILPPYKGSAFHGGFGHALKKISPIWYRKLFEPGQTVNRGAEQVGHLQKKTAWPKPFVLLPPLDEKRNYLPGHRFDCELTLFGHATQHISLCHAALEYLGGEMGLGRTHGKYKIETVPCVTLSDEEPDEEKSTYQCAVLSCEEIAASRSQLNPWELTLNFPTRLRLKTNNQLCRKELPFKLFIERLLGRLNTLAVFYGEGEIIARSQRQALLEQAQSITVKTCNLRWDDWHRFSGRQEAWMKFGGLLGSITYQGNLQPFIPYLVLGEWTHVGGKTSFGLGKYEILPTIKN